MLKLLLTSLAATAVAPVWAQEGVALAGMEASRDNQYAYLGVVLPVPGQQLGQGFVQRYWLDYVAYRYEKSPQQDIDAKVAGTEAALGYQRGNGGGWWGAYVGARYANTRLSPGDPENNDRGWRLRAKLQFEGETQVGTGWRVNAIASHLVGDANYWARLRLQTMLGNRWHIGPEAIVQGDANYRAYKVGAFLGNIKLGTSNALTLKAGMSRTAGVSASSYAGAEFYIPF